MDVIDHQQVRALYSVDNPSDTFLNVLANARREANRADPSHKSADYKVAIQQIDDLALYYEVVTGLSRLEADAITSKLQFLQAGVNQISCVFGTLNEVPPASSNRLSNRINYLGHVVAYRKLSERIHRQMDQRDTEYRMGDLQILVDLIEPILNEADDNQDHIPDQVRADGAVVQEHLLSSMQQYIIDWNQAIDDDVSQAIFDECIANFESACNNPCGFEANEFRKILGSLGYSLSYLGDAGWEVIHPDYTSEQSDAEGGTSPDFMSEHSDAEKGSLPSSPEHTQASMDLARPEPIHPPRSGMNPQALNLQAPNPSTVVFYSGAFQRIS